MPIFPNLNPRAYCQKCHLLVPEGEEIVAEKNEHEPWRIWHIECPADVQAQATMRSIAESLLRMAILLEHIAGRVDSNG